MPVDDPRMAGSPSVLEVRRRQDHRPDPIMIRAKQACSHELWPIVSSRLFSRVGGFSFIRHDNALFRGLLLCRGVDPATPSIGG